MRPALPAKPAPLDSPAVTKLAKGRLRLSGRRSIGSLRLRFVVLARGELDLLDLLALGKVDHAHDLVPGHLLGCVDDRGSLRLAETDPAGIAVADHLLQVGVVADDRV